MLKIGMLKIGIYSIIMLKFGIFKMQNENLAESGKTRAFSVRNSPTPNSSQSAGSLSYVICSCYGSSSCHGTPAAAKV